MGSRRIKEPAMIYTLRVECIWGLHLRNECVRVIEIEDDATLEDLHLAIQSAVSFDDDHLYDFHAGRNYRNRQVRFAQSDEGDEGAYSRIRLRDVYPLGNLKLYYIFDYGGSWTFEIRKARKVHAPQPRIRYPRVIERRGLDPEQYPSSE